MELLLCRCSKRVDRASDQSHEGVRPCVETNPAALLRNGVLSKWTYVFVSLTEDILRRNKLFVMSRLCSECSLFRRSNAGGKTSLLSYAADKCYSTTRKSLRVIGTKRSLSFGEREDGNGEGGRHTLHIYVFLLEEPERALLLPQKCLKTCVCECVCLPAIVHA